MAEGQSGGVVAVAEVDADGALRPISLEVLSAALGLAEAIGETVTAVVFGGDVAGAAGQLAASGAGRVLVADDERLRAPSVEAAAAVVVAAIREVASSVVLVPGTTLGRDYAPKLAARLDVGLAADCVAFAATAGRFEATRPVFGGRAQSVVRFAGEGPHLATVRAGSFPKAEPTGKQGDVEALAVELTDADLRVRVREVAPKSAGGAKLEAADIVVSGGRGLKEPANFALVEELAAALGGAVGATRAVVDAGWRPHQEQIGQTGRTVSPKLYVAVGISGAVQHNVGMHGSDAIVAINRDPDAPIFKVASFGIVGDLFEIVPALTAELRAARG